MARSDQAFSAQLRNKVVDVFTRAIQSVEPQRKALLGQYMGQLQSDLAGMTGDEANDRIIRAIKEMKQIG